MAKYVVDAMKWTGRLLERFYSMKTTAYYAICAIGGVLLCAVFLVLLVMYIGLILIAGTWIANCVGVHDYAPLIASALSVLTFGVVLGISAGADVKKDLGL